ncbi:MAG: AAA family ATPase [Rhizobiaceae bacterium]
MNSDEGLLDYAMADSVLPTLDLSRLAQEKPTPKRFIIPNFVPAGEVTLFTGPGSAGKSLLAQQLATAKAGGKSSLRLDLNQAPAIYLTCEDDEQQLHWRQYHICNALGISMDKLAGVLHLTSLRGELDNALVELGPHGELQPSPTYERLAAVVRRTGADFVALDNVAHLFPGNENDRGEVTRFVNLLNGLAGETGAAIMLLGHPNKSGDSYSGSTAWPNAVRSHVFLEHDLQTDMRTFKAEKANYGRNGDSIRFAWVDWAFVHENDLTPDMTKAIAAATRMNAENDAFMRCLAKCTENCRNVSHQPGSNHAPKIFAGMPEAKGIKKAAFADAMERVLDMGWIELNVELWTDNHRHSKRGIRATDRGE